LLSQSFGRSDCQDGHVVVVHFAPQRHWTREPDASTAAPKVAPFSPEYWGDRGGEVVPARNGARVPAPRARALVDTDVIENNARIWGWSVGERKCRVLAGNSRQLQAEVSAFLHLYKDDVACERPGASSGGNEECAGIRAVQGRAECASSEDLNRGLEGLRPRLVVWAVYTCVCVCVRARARACMIYVYVYVYIYACLIYIYIYIHIYIYIYIHLYIHLVCVCVCVCVCVHIYIYIYIYIYLYIYIYIYTYTHTHTHTYI
jgi:hypothetical protein